MPQLPLYHTPETKNLQPITSPQIGGGLTFDGAGGKLTLHIRDLPLADPNRPLLRWIIKDGLNLTGSGAGEASAGIAATAPSGLRWRKNGAANGTTTFTGTSGVNSITTPQYGDGDLLELYPPATIDTTLDDVSITLQTD